MVLPLDLTDVKDAEVLVESLQTFVKRKIPIRFGIVPMTSSKDAIDQAKVVYHLLDTYGLSAVFSYVEAVSWDPVLAIVFYLYSPWLTLRNSQQ